MTDVTAADEHSHPPGPEPLWSESWYFDFVAADGSLGGYVRLGLQPNVGVAWYWAWLVGPDRRPVAVVDHEAPLPRRTHSLEIRAEGLWADHHCETALDHWTVANEAFGVALDEPAESYRRLVGDRVPIGFDLEWETDGEPYPYPGVDRYEVPCRVHGEILVGDEAIAFDGHGQRDHSWGVRDWWRFGWCWTSGRLDDGLRFHATDVRIPEVDISFGYVQPATGGIAVVRRFAVEENLGEHGFPTAAHMRMDAGDLEMDVTPIAFAPILLRAGDGRLSRFPRALCRFEARDGRSGHGWTEWNQPEVGAPTDPSEVVDPH